MKQVMDILNNVGGQLGVGTPGPGAPQSGQAGATPAAAPGGFDLSSLLQGKGGLATGAAAGGLAGLLLGGKKSRKFAGNALKVGGLAVAGGLAFKAYQDWQRNKTAGGGTAPAEPQAERFLPSAPAQQDVLTNHLVGAMIAAAKADGHISTEEQARIEGQLIELPLDDAARGAVRTMLQKPPTIDELVGYAQTPEEAAEIYTASLLVIDPEGPAEKGYLAMLAARLQLDPELVQHLHAQVDEVAAG